MIKVENIQVNRGGKTIIKDASFQIEPGRVNVIVGKNGAGKSTLFEAITGKNPIANGRIIWDGTELKNMNVSTLATRRAVLSQKVDISFLIKVKELVEMGTYVSSQSLSKKKIKELVNDALEEVELLDYQDRDYTTLSGGEQKRALFAKCIVQLNCSNWTNTTTKYLFLDEPTANLDIEQQFKLINFIHRFVKRHNIGVLVILHDLNLAAQLADQLIILRKGVLLKKGVPKTVLTPDIIQKAFDIEALVQEHPIYKCPLITPLPKQTLTTKYSYKYI